jgi:hypothetical protein
MEIFSMTTESSYIRDRLQTLKSKARGCMSLVAACRNHLREAGERSPSREQGNIKTTQDSIAYDSTARHLTDREVPAVPELPDQSRAEENVNPDASGLQVLQG